jgi:transcriptional regulator with XRE-family HTH domain
MSKIINVEFGKKVKQMRQMRGMTQEELAEVIKTSYKYIQRIESKTPPDVRLTTIHKIAKALGTKIPNLFNS